jgi:hypothetical protein
MRKMTPPSDSSDDDNQQIDWSGLRWNQLDSDRERALDCHARLAVSSLRMASSCAARRPMTRRPLARIAFALALAVVVLPATLEASTSTFDRVTASPSTGRLAVACTRFAARWGRDDGRGTKTRPFKTAQRLADSLRQGQTGCLRGGRYDEENDGYVLRVEHGGTSRSPVTIRSFPGERAKLFGIVTVVRGADHVRLSRLAIEGSGGQNTIKIYAADTVVEDSDIRNALRGQSCMILGSTSGYGEAIRPVVRRNRFYDCGSPANDNKDHAVYASNTVGGQILGNMFWRTAGYSIHLYPNARRTRVAHNVIDGGAPSVRGGVVFGGDSDFASNENVVEFNVVAYAETHNITSTWNRLIGRGNVARANCVWKAKEGNIDTSDGGFTAQSNIVAPPLFVNRDRRDYRLKRGSRCRRVVGYDAAARLRRR